MKIALKFGLTAALAFWISFAFAQQLEIIALRSKSVEDVLPVLLPLVEPGGTLTGSNNQLFLKASPGNRGEIKRVLAAIDQPSRRLIIRISQSRQNEQTARGGQASGEVVLGGTGRSRLDAQVWDTKSMRGQNSSQMVQTVEGGQAFIQVGRSLAIPMRQMVVGPGGAVVSEGVVFRDVAAGFYAVPHVNGERVSLEISQQADTMNPQGRGTINTQRLSTTVSGRLGEWIELGGSGRQAGSNQSGTLSLSTSDARDNRSIWLMVEEVQ